MGGRGSSSNMSGGGGSRTSVMNMNTKFSSKEINSMNRSQLETVARAVFVKQNVARGMSVEEANHRAVLLMSGNTDAQLRKFIRKNG